MQIVPFEKEYFGKTSKMLESCIKDPDRELSEYIQNDSVFIYCAKDKDEILGVICILKTPDTVDILDIATDEKYKRQAVASSLIEFVFDICKKEEIFSLMLEVRESNTPAVNLYHKLGFEKISIRKNYYNNPTEDGMIYRREIK